MASASGVGLMAKGAAPKPVDPTLAQKYLKQFQTQQLAVTGTPGDDIWPWMEKNLPWFESSDEQIERIYYFRWYSLHKHIVDTEKGRLLTEFLLPVKWGGYAQTIPDAVPHHLRDVRWLRQDSVAGDYARFWCSTDATPRTYSLALADSVYSVALAKGDTKLTADLLPALSENYSQWEKSQQDKNGLFWSVDTRDGMEISISGDGYRPTLNSYMYGDAVALAAMARLQGDQAAQKKWETKASQQRDRVERELWNPANSFYEVRSPAADSGLRHEKKFKDNGTALKLAGVRELIGYVPWYYNLPLNVDRAVAWKQLFDPQGFAGAFGPTTAERRSPRFRYANDDQCQWNGPVWAYATTQTLVSLGNVLNGPAQSHVGKKEYLKLMQIYAHSHQLRLASGEVAAWLDEAQDADTGDWITRDILRERKSPLIGRGSYYNHSGFADPLITGLVGLRPRQDDVLEINPLIPDGAWRYYAMDALPYHGHLLRIQYDADGSRYGAGAGMKVWVDGRLVGSRSSLGPLIAKLK
jgi:hypothetical protein